LANEALPWLFSDADELLARMDRLSVLVEEKFPEFVDGYRQKRRVVNSAASRTPSEEQAAAVSGNGNGNRAVAPVQSGGPQAVLPS
jgi:hypothetical protein